MLFSLTLTYAFENIERNTNLTDDNSSFLVLTTSDQSNRPFLMDFDGNYNDQITFTFEHKTEVFWSCGATLDGHFFIFGGIL